MGFVRVDVTVRSPGEPARAVRLNMLVDTGAMLTVVPRSLLGEIGVTPTSRRRFKVADGRWIERDVGTAEVQVGDHIGGAAVVFGEEGDEALLGVTALEALGLQVDPVSGELKPMDLLLMATA